MAVLSEADRVDAWSRWMQDNEDDTSFTKDELRDAVNATDDWIQANQANYVAALPSPFRTQSNLKQKLMLFTYVTGKRFGVGV